MPVDDCRVFQVRVAATERVLAALNRDLRDSENESKRRGARQQEEEEEKQRAAGVKVGRWLFWLTLSLQKNDWDWDWE